MLVFTVISFNNDAFSFYPISFIKVNIPGLENAPSGSV